MRFLLISISLFCLASCASYPDKNGFAENEVTDIQVYNPYFSNPENDYVYKADLGFYKKKFSGIIIVKKIGDNEHRLVFTTEMGNKIFDFSFYKEEFIVNSILEDMDKKIIRNVLQRDFTTLLKEYNRSKQSYSKEGLSIKETVVLGEKHFYFYKNNELAKIVRERKGKEKVIHHFSEINNNIADRILIDHKNIKLKIQLKRI